MSGRHTGLLVLLLCVGVAFAGISMNAGPCQNSAMLCQNFCYKETIRGQNLSDAGPCPTQTDTFGFLNKVCAVCQAGTICDFGTGACVPNTDYFTFRPCTTALTCNPWVPDYTMPLQSCVTAVCREALKQRLYGDSCTNTNQCKGNLICNASLCTTPLSGACGGNSECAVNQACIGGICQAISFSGSCAVSPDACFPSQVCNPITQVCVNAFTLANDVSCSATPKIEMLGCPNGAICTSVSLGSTAKTCQNGVQITDYGCQPYATVNCDTQRTCACNVMSGWGQCFNASSQNTCVQQWRDYLTCTENFGCRWEGMRAYNGTCIRKNCFLQFSSLLTCSQTPIPMPTVVQGPFFPVFPDSCRVAQWVQNVLNSDRGSASVLENLW